MSGAVLASPSYRPEATLAAACPSLPVCTRQLRLPSPGQTLSEKKFLKTRSDLPSPPPLPAPCCCVPGQGWEPERRPSRGWLPQAPAIQASRLLPRETVALAALSTRLRRADLGRRDVEGGARCLHVGEAVSTRTEESVPPARGRAKQGLLADSKQRTRGSCPATPQMVTRRPGPALWAHAVGAGSTAPEAKPGKQHSTPEPRGRKARVQSKANATRACRPRRRRDRKPGNQSPACRLVPLPRVQSLLGADRRGFYNAGVLLLLSKSRNVTKLKSDTLLREPGVRGAVTVNSGQACRASPCC